MDKQVSFAWKKYSAALRVNGEHILRFKTIFSMDENEAIENALLGFEGVLESLHRLYDLSKKNLSIDLYDDDCCHILLQIRNVFHHLGGHPIRLGFEFINNDPHSPMTLLQYKAAQERIPSELIISLFDLYTINNMPSEETRFKERTKNIFSQYFFFNQCKEYCISNEVDYKDSLVDIMPILIVASKRIAKELNGKIELVGDDASFAMKHFLDVQSFILSNPIFSIV